MDSMLAFFVGSVVGFFVTAVVIAATDKAAENKRKAKYELEDRMREIAKREVKCEAVTWDSYIKYDAQIRESFAKLNGRLDEAAPPKRRKGDKK